MPMAPDQPPYVMLQKDGKNVCALYENQKAQPSWLSYVAVAKVDDGAQKAKSLGAQLLSEPFDVLDVGRMANIRDPQGARFAIWEARRQKGADVINEPNTMCWNELSSNDIDASRKFYFAVDACDAAGQNHSERRFTASRAISRRSAASRSLRTLSGRPSRSFSSPCHPEQGNCTLPQMVR